MGVRAVGNRVWVCLLVFVSVVTIISLPPALLLIAGLAQVELSTGGLVVTLKETGGLAAFLSAIVLGKLLLTSAWMLGRVPGVSVRRWGKVRSLLPGALVGLTLWVVMGLLPQLNLSGPEHSFIQALGSSATPRDLVFFSLAMILVIPVCEETYFRGSLQPALDHALGFKLSVLLGALSFAALHAQGQLLLAYTVIGVVLTLLADRFGMLASICAHSTFNLLCLISFLTR